MTQKPSVGRIVHLYDRDRAYIGPYACIVTRVHADGTTIDGEAFPSNAFGHVHDVPLANDGTADNRPPLWRWWDWPGRV